MITEMTYPNEIEKTEGEIKVLQAKLELLKEMENHKSPAEEAYKRFFGCYPDTGVSWNSDKENWYFFQVGYNASQKDCKVEEEPEQATLYDVVRHGLEYSIDMCDEIVDSVRCWLPNEMEYDEDLNGYRAGWNDCINTLNKQLR
jgi:hypothetical protein